MWKASSLPVEHVESGMGWLCPVHSVDQPSDWHVSPVWLCPGIRGVGFADIPMADIRTVA